MTDSKPPSKILLGPANFAAQDFIRPGFTLEEILELKSAFDLFDLDKSGTIQVSELKKIIEDFGLDPQNAAIAQLLSEIDADGSGQIEFPEFLDMISGKITDETSKAEVQKVFSVFDKDKTGFITFANLRQLADELGQQLSDSTLERLIAKGDSDSDSKNYSLIDIMERGKLMDWESDGKKNKHVKSERVLMFPRVKVKFGPTTPVSPHYETMRSFYKTKEFKSMSPQCLSLDFRPSSPKVGFLDSLISRYEHGTEDHVDITSKLVKPQDVHLYWKALTPNGYIPSARVGATMNIISDSVYIFAGEKADDSSDLKKFEYVPQIWRKMIPKNTNPSEIPVVKSGHTTVVYKNTLVVYGGFSIFDAALQIRNCTPLVYLFDIASCKWKSFKPTGEVPEPRRGHGAALVGHSLVVYSGLNCRGKIEDSLAVLDLDQMRWGYFHIHGEKPQSRKGFTLTSVFHRSLLDAHNFDVFSVPKYTDNVFSKLNSGIYMFGGLSDRVALNDLFVLKGQSAKTKSVMGELVWNRITPSGKMPMGRYGHCACVANGFFIVMGGRNEAVSGGVVNELAVLRIACWRWETVKVFGESLSGRVGACCGSLGNRMLLFGGMHLNTFANANLYELETDQKQVNELKNSPRFSLERRNTGMKNL